MPLLPQYEVDQCGRESIVVFFLMFKFCCFVSNLLFVCTILAIVPFVQYTIDLMSVQ